MDRSHLSVETSLLERTSAGQEMKNGEGKANSPGGRFDNSLGLLARKFVEMMQAGNGSLDLNAATKRLNVQKRRIYDITNVLEGIGLVEKKSKNIITWRPANSPSPLKKKECVDSYMEAIALLNAEECDLDAQIEMEKEKLQKLTQSAHMSKEGIDLAHVTHEELRSLPCLKNKSAIVIKAPSGSTLEVPDPDEDMPAGKRRYQMFLKSSTGPIDVYLVGEEENHVTRVSPTCADPDYAFSSNDTEGITDYFCT